MEILPFLYLGSAYHAARRDMLDALGITALLNVSSDCPNHFEGHYQYKCIPVEDNHKADISSWFMEAIEYIGRLALARVLSSRMGRWVQGWQRQEGREEGTTWSWRDLGRALPRGCLFSLFLSGKAGPWGVELPRGRKMDLIKPQALLADRAKNLCLHVPPAKQIRLWGGEEGPERTGSLFLLQQMRSPLCVLARGFSMCIS